MSPKVFLGPFAMLAFLLYRFCILINLNHAAALALYISILEQQSKYDTALEVLSGELGSLLGREEDKLRLQVI
jgi:hypothetical protein